MMRKILCLVLLTLSACAEGVGDVQDVDANPAILPVQPKPPTVVVTGPLADIDGEYAMRVDQVSYLCNGDSSDEAVSYALANVVEQTGTAKFDLLARGAGGFDDFTHWNVEREASGFFTGEDSFDWYITPGYPPAVFTSNATGSVTSDVLAFLNHWIVGWYDAGGVFNQICEITYDDVGQRRYPNWDGAPRASIDGQWRVWHENMENSLGIPDEPSFQVIDTIAQNDSGSAFDLKWARLNFNNVPRAADGSVNHSFWSGDSFFVVSGVVDNDYLDLEITWDWHDTSTGTLIWHVKDRYTGTPRFQPHEPGNYEPLTGAFNAELAQTFDSCDGILNVHRYVVEALPADDGQIWLWVGGLKLPLFTPDADGAFSITFVRQDDWRYKYALENGKINGDSISFTMHAEALWPDSGVLYCASDYVVTGNKRYVHLFSSEP